jgi:hypothetical protein
MSESAPESTTSTVREIAYVLCPYLMGLDSGEWDPARPVEHPLPACKRCEPKERGMPGCLFFAQIATTAVVDELRKRGVHV